MRTTAYCILALLLTSLARSAPAIEGRGRRDEASVRQVVQRFFILYAQKQLDNLMALWAENSPDAADRRIAMQGVFADSGDIRILDLRMLPIMVVGDTAQINVLADLAGVDAKTGKPDESFRNLHRVVHLVRRGSEWKVWAYRDTQDELPEELLAARSEPERAQLLQFEKDIVTAELVRTLNTTDSNQTAQGRFDVALRTNDIALEAAQFVLDKKAQAWCYVHRGLIFLAEKNYPLALEYHERALSQFRETGNGRAEEAKVLNNFGVILGSMRKYRAALEKYRSGLRMSQALGDQDNVCRCFWGMGDVYRAERRWGEAIGSYRQSVKSIEDIRAHAKVGSDLSGFFAVYATPYYRLTECLLERRSSKENWEALAVSEQVKARTLRDLMQSRRDTNQHGERAPLGQELVTDRAVRARTQAILSRRPSLCLLSYLVDDDETVLFVVTPGIFSQSPNLSVYRLPVRRKEFTDLVEEFRQRCSMPGAHYRQQAQDLFRRLLSPATEQLTAAWTLVIMPDGELNTLPFQALVDARDRHLIEDHYIVYAPSLTTFAEIQEAADQRRKSTDESAMPSVPQANPPTRTIPVLIMANPTMPKGVIPLPGAAEQAEMIGRYFGVRPLTGAEASESRAKAEMPTARYIFFSTHGSADAANGLQSAILLAKDVHDDGLLTAAEVAQLKLKAELVVVDACNTALGQQVRGEGLIGLPQGFLAAGAPSIVVTQWIVGDESASLMVDLFRRLETAIKGQGYRMYKMVALWEAQNSLMHDGLHGHPAYWAPYILIGDWR